MRNLKKILALVLALVMVIGLMGVASAAKPGTSYKDDAAIGNYDEAVQVLTALGIYEGDENAAFNPNNTITRAEVATLVYRIVTGDTEGKHVALYTDYNKFADVDSNAWYAGYVNFCANGGYLMGDGTNFYPMEKVTGYQVLAIMLRVLGYGQEGEYEGANWHIRTATKADELGITSTVVPGTLGAYSTRGMVAELLYRAIAQTSVVKYDRINLYTKLNATYAFLHFGLVGQTGYWDNDHADYRPDANGIYNLDGYKWMTIRSKAEADDKYGEPVAYWYTVKLDNAPSYKNCWKVTGEIEIRFNTVATYSDYVNEKTLYGFGKVAYNYAIDGVDLANVAMDGSGKTTAEGTARGVTTEVFVADGRMFVVVKNNWVGINVYDWNAKYQTSVIWADNHPYDITNNYIYNDKVMGHVETDADGVTAHIAKNTVVLYNTYEASERHWVIDIESVRKADKLGAQTIAWSYIPANNYAGQELQDKSTFTVGTTNYIYSFGYNKTMIDPMLDREALVAAGQVVQDLYFDDYGNVIYTVPTTFYTNVETGYVVIRYGSYGIRVADNRWVVDFAAIDANGNNVTIRGAVSDTGYFLTQREADETAAAIRGMYFYTKVGEYYALTPVVDDSDDRAEDKAQGYGIYAGKADSLAYMGEEHLIDSDTLFVIAEYDLTGAITGYKVVKGFKNIPNLVNALGNLKVEYIYNEYDEVVFIYVENAAQVAQDVGTPIADTCFYLLDTNPSKQFNQFDRHTVIINGEIKTLDFVKGYVNGNNAYQYKFPSGFYYVTALKNGLVNGITAAPAGNILYNLDIVAKDVLKCGFGSELNVQYFALADSCVVYNIDTAKGTVSVIPADKYFSYEALSAKGGYGFAAAVDAYGYITVLYMVNAQ